MICTQAERVFAAPPPAVFDQLTDPTTWHDWLPGHGGWPDGIPTTIEQNATVRLRLGFFGIFDTVTMTIEEKHAPDTLVLCADGNLGASTRIWFGLTDRGDGSTLVCAEAEVIGTPARVVAPLAQRTLTKALSSALRQLDALVTNNQPERNHHVLLR